MPRVLAAVVGCAALYEAGCLSSSALAQTALPTAPSLPTTEVFDVGRSLFGADPTRRALRNDPFRLQPGREIGPIAVGDWLAYPTWDAGILYDDNLYASRFNRISDAALRLRPSLIAVHDTGIQTTTLYGNADARLFKDNARADTLQGTVGGTHRWEVTRDLVVRLQGDFERRADDYGQALASNSALRGALVPPVQYDQTYLSSSVRKDFDAMFAGIGASYMATRFDPVRDNAGQRYDQRYRDETDTRLIGRVGYTFSSALYAFVEPSLIWQQFREGAFDSTGYRVVGGIGSERFGLLSGEIFAGYQAQDLRDRTLPSGDGPVFGGRVSWFPTRDLTVTGILERSIGTSVLASGLNRLNTGIGLEPSFGSNTLNPLQQTISTTTTTGLQSTYAFTRELSADAAAGYQISRYSGAETQLASAQVGLKYLLLRNLGLRLDYAYAKAYAGDPLYSRNRVTVGLSGQL